MMVEAGGFHILLPLHSVFRLNAYLFIHSFIHSSKSRLILHLQDGITSLEPAHYPIGWKEGKDGTLRQA